MKKIATAIAATLAFAVATPVVLACPHEDKAVGDKAEKQEPQTADKDKAKKDAPAKKDTGKKDTATTPKTDDGKVSRN